jgi:hypothetical protein
MIRITVKGGKKNKNGVEGIEEVTWTVMQVVSKKWSKQYYNLYLKKWILVSNDQHFFKTNQ